MQPEYVNKYISDSACLIQNKLISLLNKRPDPDVTGNVVFSQEKIPDLFKLTDGDTITVGKYSLNLKVREGFENRLVRLKDNINEIHDRYVLIAGEVSGDIIPVSFVTKLPRLISTEDTEEFSKEYQRPKDPADDLAFHEKIAEEIWVFLVNGVIPR